MILSPWGEKKEEKTTEKKMPVEHTPEPGERLQGSGEEGQEQGNGADGRQPRVWICSAKYQSQFSIEEANTNLH